jgi:proline dehydrogenase
MVRGAYMVEENQKAADEGYPSPICDTYEKTTESYEGNITKLLNVRDTIKESIIFGSHNE